MGDYQGKWNNDLKETIVWKLQQGTKDQGTEEGIVERLMRDG